MLKNAIKIEIGGTPDFFEMFKNLHPLHFSEQICAPVGNIKLANEHDTNVSRGR